MLRDCGLDCEKLKVLARKYLEERGYVISYSANEKLGEEECVCQWSFNINFETVESFENEWLLALNNLDTLLDLEQTYASGLTDSQSMIREISVNLSKDIARMEDDDFSDEIQISAIIAPR